MCTQCQRPTDITTISELAHNQAGGKSRQHIESGRYKTGAKSGVVKVIKLLLGHIAVLHVKLRAVYCYPPSSTVSLSVTLVSPLKTAEQIKMAFGLRTQVGPENHVLDGGPNSP